MVLMVTFLANAIIISSTAKLTSVYSSHQNLSVKYGITVKQMFKILIKSIKNFNLGKAFEFLSVDSKADLLNETLNIFWICIPSKKIKCRFCEPRWMADSIKRSLKERPKLVGCYYKNGQKRSDLEKLFEKSSDCTKEILEAKIDCIFKMTTKLQSLKTAAKTYWAILIGLLYNKKIPAITFISGKFISDFCEKANLSITFLC